MKEKTAQMVKMLFIFAISKLKAIFRITGEVYRFVTILTSEVDENIVFFLISHNFVQAAGFENENL